SRVYVLYGGRLDVRRHRPDRDVSPTEERGPRYFEARHVQHQPPRIGRGQKDEAGDVRESAPEWTPTSSSARSPRFRLRTTRRGSRPSGGSYIRTAVATDSAPPRFAV